AALGGRARRVQERLHGRDARRRFGRVEERSGCRRVVERTAERDRVGPGQRDERGERRLQAGAVDRAVTTEGRQNARLARRGGYEGEFGTEGDHGRTPVLVGRGESGGPQEAGDPRIGYGRRVAADRHV